MEQDIAEIVEEIEKEKALGKISAVQVFRGMLNQPELLSVSSANAEQTGSSYAYSQFTVNMPRPVLEAETLQLLAANIPLCTQNFPDTACGFWYYRTDEYVGVVPSIENLFFVRLLPSYYKPEFLGGTKYTYGQNQTFNTYNDVLAQLSLNTIADVAYVNKTIQDFATDPTTYDLHYTPNDVSFGIATNKFQMTGLNINAPLAPYAYPVSYTPAAWNSGTTYSIGQNVTTGGKWYQSLLNSNTNHNPAVTSVWWIEVPRNITYSSGTTYALGDYVWYSNTLFRSLQNSNTAHTPSTYPPTPDVWWTLVTTKMVRNIASGVAYRQKQYAVNPIDGLVYQAKMDVYSTSVPTVTGPPTTDWQLAPKTITGTSNVYRFRYLITGYSDPNVALLQGTGKKQWSPYAVYEASDYVEYQGTTYQAGQQNKGWTPFPTASATTYTTSKTDYKAGDVVYALLSYWKCIYNNPPANSITANPFTCATYWIPSYWTPQSTSANLPVVGLNAISSKFDFTDFFGNAVQNPFPYGIPGQPFNPAPRRLLNSLLGFCWNGLFDPTAVDDTFATSSQILYAGSVTDLLNRIRPVPAYYQPNPTPASYDETLMYPTATPLYTADGYANLVYTSIISIYSTIVYGSTLDSQRNTNLIGLSSMNAGNLGVSFFDNKINGPLRVKGSDIYSIGIELRDEMNEPYPVTNNGITTFTLKLTYKENLAEK